MKVISATSIRTQPTKDKIEDNPKSRNLLAVWESDINLTRFIANSMIARRRQNSYNPHLLS